METDLLLIAISFIFVIFPAKLHSNLSFYFSSIFSGFKDRRRVIKVKLEVLGCLLALLIAKIYSNKFIRIYKTCIFIENKLFLRISRQEKTKI